MAGNPIAVIVAVGPGTGASIARRFASAYPVVLLARSPENYEAVAADINKKGGKAIGISTDVSNESSVNAAFEKINQEFNGAPIAAAIFNASTRPKRKSVLELSVEEYQNGFDVSGKGALIFSKAVLPGLLEHGEDNPTQSPPTLIFTGATASVKSNALMAGFATHKFALRALSFSIAREFAPKGVHVAHAVVDGAIDTPFTQGFIADWASEASISSDDIAETYWNLHQQSRRCFTNEIDIRPMMEKW
ncbi:Putative short-chain dehydrogenase/reductase SDR, NAD(P)-binding domain superfamily [Septoria linicola]|uniref:Short-chain dehydrogenase/reductase SDR, NAD(P)-binding domain superfamily n=1 Tax=Septoria linicola TaxID=215465 RepID=A0A9Q9B070_9PEZI|nr:Putative short-chain dehydrogenase/reductase SDR, NAD(P)-binding domain superfamily [Septoria linicola]